jgi:hypothetical protein|tara:strand:- start:24 stop:521 length:498 start_codon:yes stop_codon:yes gene_type:complete
MNTDRGGLRFFSEGQSALMQSVLNRIIPSDDKYPGAGDLGLVAYIDKVMFDPIYLARHDKSLRRIFIEGMNQIEICASGEFQGEFVSLVSDQQTAVLKNIEKEFPEFFNALITYTYNGYYTDYRILKICGAPTRPPQPLGHKLSDSDLSSTELVKSRGAIYKEVD